MPRRLIVKCANQTSNASDTATELLTSIIEFMEYAETSIKPVLLEAPKYFVVSMTLLNDGPIELG